ncbi:tudor domain-containing protein 5 [Erpetoichthys calabaricus]|uniref:Tudor domain-containing protein 5 n=1 Tax=Erpetoichthys calabaricus TaxID=27687 RepID=A0A8C4SVN3_ERPCA|nr:tudor domain-containing protein 5 [Erpetoichthys calabaricus]
MTHQEDLLNRLKKDIRSLLIASKMGVAIEHLQHDYKKMLGHAIPLRDLGYHSVIDMVSSMPDVIQVEYTNAGSTILKGVGNDSTRGIEDLVAKQRPPTRKTGHNNRGCKMRNCELPRPHRRAKVIPVLPAALCSKLKQLLSSSPVLLSQLEDAFRSRFGHSLQASHYGFYSIMEILQKMSDIVVVEQTRAGSLLCLKKPPQTNSLQAGFSGKAPSDSVTENTANQYKSESVPKKEVVQLTPESTASKPCSALAKVSGLKLDHSHKMLSQLPTKSGTFENNIKKLEKQIKAEIAKCGPAGGVSHELKKKIRSVVSQHPTGLPVNKLPLEYKKMYNEDLPVSQLGFISVIDLVNTLSDTLILDRGKEDLNINWLVFDIQQADTKSGVKNKSEFQSLNQSNDSYLLSNQMSLWEDNNIEKLTEKVESDFKIVNIKFQQTLDISEDEICKLQANSRGPLDAFRDGNLQPPPQMEEKTMVSVLVETVVSPSQFYVRFNETEDCKLLLNMMIEMRVCYSSKEASQRYRLPENFFRVGQVCCVETSTLWFYRGIVHRIISEQYVEVHYVDFGNFDQVEKNRVKFLKCVYSKLPAQAVPATLTWIKPFKDTWSETAISVFQKFCWARPLVALIHKYVNGILHLFLCDTYTQEDIYIHTVLQIQGYAVPCNLEDISEVTPSENQPHSPCQPLTPDGSDATDDFSDLPELELISEQNDLQDESLQCEMTMNNVVQQNEKSVACLEDKTSSKKNPYTAAVDTNEDLSCNLPSTSKEIYSGQLVSTPSICSPPKRGARPIFPVFAGGRLYGDLHCLPRSFASSIL